MGVQVAKEEVSLVILVGWGPRLVQSAVLRIAVTMTLHMFLSVGKLQKPHQLVCFWRGFFQHHSNGAGFMIELFY